MRGIRLIITVAALIPVWGAFLFAQEKTQEGKMESLLLRLQKISLGTLSGKEEKKQYLTTIELEKQRIQAHTLRGIYENAFDLYKSRDYERSEELASKILAIDPNFQDAMLLTQAAGQLKGARRAAISEKAMLEDRSQEALSLYKEGRLVESAKKWEEVLKLSPSNMKAQHWLKKVRQEISDDHVKRGNQAYSRGQLTRALDQWYNALLLKKDDPQLVERIKLAEEELRTQEVNQNFQRAMELYSQGKLTGAHDALKAILAVQPGDPKAQKLVNELQGEIASGYIAAGKKSYALREYPLAISNWEKAQDWGYDKKYVGLLIVRAQEQMRREQDYRRQKADAAKKAAMEAAERERKEQEESRKKQMQLELHTETSGKTVPGGGGGVSEENRRAAQQRYLSGLKYYNDGDYDKARNEWTVAKQLDPSNSDADTGLRRIEQMFGAGQ